MIVNAEELFPDIVPSELADLLSGKNMKSFFIICIDADGKCGCQYMIENKSLEHLYRMKRAMDQTISIHKDFEGRMELPE